MKEVQRQARRKLTGRHPIFTEIEVEIMGNYNIALAERMEVLRSAINRAFGKPSTEARSDINYKEQK